MAEIPAWCEELFTEEEKQSIKKENGFEETIAVKVSNGTKEEHRVLVEYLDERNPHVVTPVKGVRLYTYDTDEEILAFESKENFEDSTQDEGWYVK